MLLLKYKKSYAACSNKTLPRWKFFTPYKNSSPTFFWADKKGSGVTSIVEWTVFQSIRPLCKNSTVDIKSAHPNVHIDIFMQVCYTHQSGQELQAIKTTMMALKDKPQGTHIRHILNNWINVNKTCSKKWMKFSNLAMVKILDISGVASSSKFWILQEIM